MKRSVRNRLIVALILALLGICQAIYVHNVPYFPVDVQAAQWLQSIHNQILLSLMIGISQAFTSWPAFFLIIACVVAAWWRLGRLEAATVAVAALISPLNELVKIIVNQPRPPASLVHILLPALGPGFPSGHSFFTAMLLGIMAYFVLRYVKPRPFKFFLAATLIFLILLVGFSRVYLGAHWGSDVVGAYILAGVFLSLLTVGYEEVQNKLERRQGTPGQTPLIP
jgi:membrane-associated phospholipid phosphatase